MIAAFYECTYNWRPSDGWKQTQAWTFIGMLDESLGPACISPKYFPGAVVRYYYNMARGKIDSYCYNDTWGNFDVKKL